MISTSESESESTTESSSEPGSDVCSLAWSSVAAFTNAS